MLRGPVQWGVMLIFCERAKRRGAPCFPAKSGFVKSEARKMEKLPLALICKAAFNGERIFPIKKAVF
jgi:hypothetical protein